MALAVDYTAQRPGLTALGALAQERSPLVPDVDFTDNTPDADDVAGAMFMRETLVGELVDELKERTAASKGTPDPWFNPYSFFADNKKAFEDFPELEYFVRTGTLHDTKSPEEFQARSDSIRRELDRRGLIAEGGALGITAGMVLSFADVTTLVPFVGMAGKAGVLAKAGIGAAEAAALVGAQELVLHGLQDVRTTRESLEAVGIGTLLGGGLGAFAGALSRGHTLHPTNPSNPLRVDVEVPIESTVGAAASPTRRFDPAADTGLGIVDTISRAFRIPTSVARALSKLDPESAGVMQDLSHLGIPTRQNEAGVASRESAEEIYEAEYNVKFLATREDLSDIFYELNAALGSKSSSLKEDLNVITGGRIKNPVTAEEWSTHLFRRLNDPNYTAGTPEIDAALSKGAEAVRKHLDYMHSRGVELGMWPAEQKLDNYLIQRWRAERIIENPNDFRAFLVEKFMKRPDEDWLRENYGLGVDEFDNLPIDDKRLREIQEAWTIDTEAANLRRLEDLAEASELRVKDAEVAFKQALGTAKKLDDAYFATSVKNARAAVQFREASLTTARERLEALRLEEKSLVEAATAARQRTLDRQLGFNPQTGEVVSKLGDQLNLPGLKAAKEPPLERTPAQAQQSQRALDIANQRLRQESKVKRMETRLAKLKERADALEQAHLSLKNARKTHADTLRTARAELKKATRTKKKTDSKLKAAQSQKDIIEQANEIVQAITDRRKVPWGFLHNAVMPSARVKQRGIHLKPDELAEAVARGWLDTDVPNLLQVYTRDIGGRLAMREKFGSEDLASEFKKLSENFAKLKDEAKTAKERQRLVDMETAAKETMEVLRDRVLGRYGIPDDPESALMFFSRTARNVNFLRYMGGVLASSITDTATSALSNGGMGQTLKSGLGKRIKKFANQMDDHEVRAMLFGAENSLAFSRHGKNMGLDDLIYERGFGGGLTRKVSSAVDGTLRAMSEKMNVLNGMAWWNSRMRFISGQVQMQNILKDAKLVSEGGSLPAHRITEYARLGFDMNDLRQVAAMIQKHGEVNEAGLVDPNGGAWLSTQGGFEAHRKLMVLLKRASQEAVPYPTAGDLPPFMSRAAGKMFFQFQSFGFAVVNKYVRNLRYKAVNGQAWDALMSVTWGLAMGTTAYVIKEGVFKNRELSDKPGTWVYEAFDRSGLLMYFMPYVNGAFKLGAPALSSMGVDWFDVPSRFRQQSWLTAFLGPTFGLMEDVEGFGTSVANADVERSLEKGRRLIPFQNLFYLQALWAHAHGVEK